MARAAIVEALDQARAVAVLGARQVGKSTLVREIATSEHPARYVTLDDKANRDAAREDPIGFAAALSAPAVIDEIQRAPDLLLAIKARLDVNRARGQFLLTGSANLLTARTIADALPGRLLYVSLWPLAQAEIERTERYDLVDRLFDGPLPTITGEPVGRAAFASRLVVGGFPEVQELNFRARSAFFRSYVASTLDRTLDDIASVRDRTNLERLMRLVASRTGGIASYHGMAQDLGIDPNTVRTHTGILESLYMLHRIPAWHRNLGSRLVKSEKIHVVDSGLLCHLLGTDEGRMVSDGGVAGQTLECFVAMELVRLSELSSQPILISHYRDQKQREVDVVLERSNGEIVGVEVKAASTPTSSDFAGLRYFRDKLGDRFRRGILLHGGADALPFGDRLAALPIGTLWHAS